VANDIVSNYGVAADCGSYRYGAGGKVWRCAHYAVAADLAIGTPVVLVPTKDYALTAIVPAAETSLQYVGISPVVYTDTDAYIWFQVQGECEALVNGTSADVVAGEFLEVITTGTALIKEGTVKDVGSVAVAVDAQAANSAVLVTVNLLGIPVAIAGS
jgi:hypothetical protein